MPKPYRSILLCITGVSIAVFVSASPGHGQGLSKLVGQIQGDEGVGLVVDGEAEAAAIETARRSLERTLRQEADRQIEARGGVSKSAAERIDALNLEAVEDFLREVEDELYGSKGDGLLTRDELSEEIGEARDYILDDYRGALQAVVDGANRPPSLESGKGVLSFVAAMTRYILVERNPPRVWAILGGWILGAMLAAFLMSRVFTWLGRHERVVAWTGAPLAIAGQPLMLIAFAFGLSAGRAWIWLPVSIEDVLAIAVKALAIAGFLWLWWRLSGHLARGIARMFGVSGDARGEATDVVRKGLRLLGIAIALLIVAEFIFDTDVSVFLTGVGVISIAASVAAQDTLRNLMASVTIHSDRPFVLGDLVRFKDELGHIEEIGFRSTRLRTLDGPVVVIPNGELVRESIVNLSARTHIRHHYAIDLVYGTSPERMQEAVGILQEILESREYRDGQEPHVSFDAYGEYSLRIELWYTSKTGDYFEAKRERDEVNREILGRFGEAGLEFAFPTRTLQFEADAESAGRLESTEGEDGEEGEEEIADERDDASVSDESETAAVGRN